MSHSRRSVLKFGGAGGLVLAVGAPFALTACGGTIGGFKQGEVIGRVRPKAGEQLSRTQALEQLLDLYDLSAAKRAELRGHVALTTCDEHAAQYPITGGTRQKLDGLVVIIDESEAGAYDGPDANFNTHPTADQMYIGDGDVWYFFVLYTDEEFPVEESVSAQELQEMFVLEGADPMNIVLLDDGGHVTQDAAKARRVIRTQGRLSPESTASRVIDTIQDALDSGDHQGTEEPTGTSKPVSMVA